MCGLELKKKKKKLQTFSVCFWQEASRDVNRTSQMRSQRTCNQELLIGLELQRVIKQSQRLIDWQIVHIDSTALWQLSYLLWAPSYGDSRHSAEYIMRLKKNKEFFKLQQLSYTHDFYTVQTNAAPMIKHLPRRQLWNYCTKHEK